VARVSAEDALAIGLTGPPSRQRSGLGHPARYAYSGYENFKSKCLSPKTVMSGRAMSAALKSCGNRVKIAKQAAGRHASGSIKADAPKVVLPDREKMKTQMEALI